MGINRPMREQVAQGEKLNLLNSLSDPMCAHNIVPVMPKGEDRFQRFSDVNVKLIM